MNKSVFFAHPEGSVQGSWGRASGEGAQRDLPAGKSSTSAREGAGHPRGVWVPQRLPEEAERATHHLQTAPEVYGGFRWDTHTHTLTRLNISVDWVFYTSPCLV